MTHQSAEDTREVATPSRPVHGQTTVTPRALDRMAAAIAAEFFGVMPNAVDVKVADHHGLIGLTIATPIPVPVLTATEQHATRAQPDQQPILQQVTTAQDHLHQRFTDLTGAQVGHVTIRVNGITTDDRRALR